MVVIEFHLSLYIPVVYVIGHVSRAPLKIAPAMLILQFAECVVERARVHHFPRDQPRYSSDQGQGGGLKLPVVERLSHSWTGTRGDPPSVPLDPFPPPGLSACQEGEVLFKRNGT